MMAGKTADEIAAAWQILYTLEWSCHAVSDGGIDAREEKDRHTIGLTADDVVFDGSEPVGVRFEGHLFLFDDPATHTFYVERYCGYVGGWGEIYETSEYTLQRSGA